MFHQTVTLPESHPDYPCVWQSECGKWRAICVDNIQYIVQQYRSPKWRSKSYHVEWLSILLRWSEEITFDNLPPASLQSGLQEPNQVL